jgi:hypothetical protein
MQIESTALEEALLHIEHRGDTDIFPLPFEFLAIRHSWQSIRQLFLDCNPVDWAPRQSRQALIPKGEFGFRLATQLDPMDSIFLTALVLQFADKLEGARVPISEKIVFSHRYSPGPRGQIFDPNCNYEAFRQRSLELAGFGSVSHVVITDIGDFYSRIYQHPLQNAIAEATDDEVGHVFGRFFSRISSKASHGIPIGPGVCRLLADLDINDIDFALKTESYVFCRYSDDFRIFARSEKEARQALSFLAQTLYRNHGLTLQASKTEILTRDEFLSKYGESDDSRAGQRFQQLQDQSIIFLSSPYQFVTWEDLDDEQKDNLISANLFSLFEEALSQDPVDMRVALFALRWLRLTSEESHVPFVLANLDTLYSIFPSVMDYLLKFAGAKPDQATFATKILKLLEHQKVGVLDFHRELVLNPFTTQPDWNHMDDLIAIYNNHHDAPTRRAVILALGTQKQSNWFKLKKHEASDMKEWEKRAFLFGARCMARDEGDAWFSSVNPHLTELDRAVVKYAKFKR